jgi:uncharacterized membrane protein YciS (DUF1049 family)
MSFKVFFKTLVFLVVLFVMLYIGMENRQSADFYFPIMQEKKFTTDAAMIYYAMFAVGVLTGMVLTAGSGKGGRGKAPSKSEK